MSVTNNANKPRIMNLRFYLLMIVLNAILVIFNFVMTTTDSGISWLSWIGLILNGLSLVIFIDLFRKEKKVETE